MYVFVSQVICIPQPNNIMIELNRPFNSNLAIRIAYHHCKRS